MKQSILDLTTLLFSSFLSSYLRGKHVFLQNDDVVDDSVVGDGDENERYTSLKRRSLKKSEKKTDEGSK